MIQVQELTVREVLKNPFVNDRALGGDEDLYGTTVNVGDPFHFVAVHKLRAKEHCDETDKIEIVVCKLADINIGRAEQDYVGLPGTYTTFSCIAERGIDPQALPF